jgi:hypothetical protein
MSVQELTAFRYDSATTRALAFKLSFISLISLSTSSMNLIKKFRDHTLFDPKYTH